MQGIIDMPDRFAQRPSQCRFKCQTIALCVPICFELVEADRSFDGEVLDVLGSLGQEPSMNPRG